MRRIKNPKQVSAFIAIGVSLMIVIKLFVLGEFQYVRDLPKVKEENTVVDEEFLYGSETMDAASNHPVFPQSFPPEFQESQAPKLYGPFLPPPAYKEPSYTGGKARVVIIIDDMGMSRARSYETINLPAPLTLAFLPYAPKLPEITKEARAHGHELMIHVPMEPMKKSLDPGPLALVEGMSAEDFDLTLSKIFESFAGYVGINNHMGSRLTQNHAAMDMVMRALEERNLLFVDSKTINTSIAAQTAAEHGLQYNERDVFLDHVDTPEAVRQSLKHLEQVARRKGVGIAIGHPKEATINALREWLPTLKAKNIELVPISKAVRREVFPAASPVIPQLPSQRLETTPAPY